MGDNVTDLGFDKKGEERELKKHAATIHCSNTLSLLQRKISNALLYHAYKELQLKEEHEISIKQLCRLIAYQGHNHTAIREALKGLISTVIEWNVVDDSTGIEDWTASTMIASVSLQGPLCLYAYSPRMKQLLHSPSMFGKINLVIQSKFKSSYGLALYENCIRYRGLPYTKWLDVSTFRKLMGVPEGKYPIFRDFKKRVLDKSIEEVNTYSDLIVEAEVVREGRQVTRIRFSLKERAKKTRIGEETRKVEARETDALRQRLIEHYGFLPEQAKTLLTDYEQPYIQEKMMVIESSRNYQQGKVQNLTAYLLSALKNNFQPSTLVKGESKVKREKKTDNLDWVYLKRQTDKIREQYLLYREEALDQAIQALTQDVKEPLITAFKEWASESIQTILRLQKNKYSEDSVITSPAIRAQLRQFALDKIPSLESGLLTFEMYITSLPEAEARIWKAFEEFENKNQVEDKAI